MDGCVCTADYGGASAEKCDNYTGSCHARCLASYGCTGPTNSDCNYCNEFSTYDQYRNCECNKNYSGEDCSTYIGVCHPTCATCTGPTAVDCVQCIGNATSGSNNDCLCKEDYFGEDCSEYKGPCHATCGACNGPDACDCEYCVNHASFDASHNCVCDTYWTAATDCSEFNGTCNPICH